MKVVIKPWGKEEWLALNDKYCYKRIYINAGYKTSFQYHEFKIETNYIISGEAEVWLENDEGVIEKKLMSAGDYMHVLPFRKHRVIAITDLILQEASTPEVDDVIRIEDDTHRENGKVEGEQKNPAVLILASGKGSRLGGLTKSINKVLLPVNNRAILSHIIGYFPDTYDFIITKGYEGNSIEEYCRLVYPNHNFIFVEIDKFEGEGTGPGYSALQCKEHLQRPFYLTVGDCLLDSPIPHIDGNWLGVSPTLHPEKYATIDVDLEDNVKIMKNKDVEGYDSAFIGMAGILNYNTFWNELENNIKDGELVCAFERPETFPTLKIKRLTWLDTGNPHDFEKTKKYMVDKPLSLKKCTNEFTYKDQGKFLKFVPDTELLKNRVTRANQLEGLIPYNFGDTPHFLHYDWYDGKTLYEYDDIDIFTKFLDFWKVNLMSLIDNNEEDLKKFYNDKTKDRVDMFMANKPPKYMSMEYEINGIKYPSMKTLQEQIPLDSIFKTNPFYRLFHGDLHFENILYNPNIERFAYIDWRDSFGDCIDGGDVYYDLAKFYGGLLIPYNLMKDESKINVTEVGSKITYSYEISENLVKFRTIYEAWVKENGFNFDKIKLITGIILLNMSPLHEANFSKMLWFKSIEMLYGGYN